MKNKISLRQKITLLLLLSVTLTLILFSTYLIYGVRAQNMAAFYENKRNLSTIILSNILPGVEFDQKAFIEKFFNSFTQDRELAFVFILNQEQQEYYKYIRPELALFSQNTLISSKSERFHLVTEQLESEIQGHLGAMVLGFDKELINQQIQQLSRQMLLLFFVLALVIVITLSIVMSRIVIFPIIELIRSTKHLAEGHLETRANEGGKDELGLLAGHFNLMAQSLSNNFNDLQQNKNEIFHLQQFLNSIIANSPTGVITIDTDTTIIQINRAAQEMLNIVQVEVEGQNLFALAPLLSPLADDLRQIYGQKSVHHFNRTILKFANTEKTFDILAYDITYRDSSAAVLLMVDISERILLERKLIQSSKMEAIGTLAGGVAHDFNNMLCAILGYTELSLSKIGPSHELFNNLEEIRNAANRSSDLTRQLLAFARKQTIAPQVLDLNKTIEGVLKMLKRLIGEDIDLTWRPSAELWHVKVDPSQIDQILANLCVNARDAIVGTGKITIESRNCTFDLKYCADHPEYLPGDYAQLTVSDNGCGMDKETLANIFDPFFTTKEMGKGTGLGLATVYGAVKQNDGFINTYSEPGTGTTFAINLPRHMEIDEPAKTAGSAEPMFQGFEIILLVEDEPAILKPTTAMLESLGYKVIAASTPEEAILLARDRGDEIQLLITDVVMPKMNGRDLSKNLARLYPQIKCLFMSGYTADVVAHHGVLDEGVFFIQKPFSKSDLASKVREVLNHDINDHDLAANENT